MLKAIVFDFDYTLGDSTNGIALSINYALGKLGHALSDISAIRNTIGLSLKETYFKLTSTDDAREAEKFVVLFKEKADSVMVANTELYSGVKDILRELKLRGYKTAVVTTKFRYRIEQILIKFDAAELFDVIVGAEDVKMVKPDPEGLYLAMKRLKVIDKEMLYVGDSLVDLEAAENAEVKFAAVLTGNTVRDDFKNHSSVYIGENISDIYKYILNEE